MTALTDPDELLEVFDKEGRGTGRARRRADIHREGLWHLAFFCWIVTREGDVVLQRRADGKDVWPGRFDASAAGHVRFGETTAQASREIEEELGLVVDPAELVPVMRHAQEDRHASGIVDREIHDVHLHRSAVPLERYRPGPEVSGLVAVPMRNLVALSERTRLELPAELVTFEGERAVRAPIVLHREDLVPYPVGYLRAIALAAAALPP
ncbi:MAG: putative Nudix hydrolase YfcD [Labilithrix sp.]|nr:putative Nudix hydrolase YfcD [Labilithrix sp.]